ncbi:MAG: family 10 glycosylhydrolase [Muribaculaceae bacterium]|nr:family 10 glycosylhydrolase [Muribaculaceae bacterium]
MTLRILLSIILLCAAAIDVPAASPKREMRAAWIQTVFQDHYSRRTPEQNREWISEQLDIMEQAGINAVIFQVRPQSDAFYRSSHEPWSRWLSGSAQNDPGWDPLQYLVDECHARSMELHAWLNPYRITSARTQTLPASHIARKHPERTVRYNGNLYFDPALPENQDWICKVVDDIVANYDIDAIHFDDYFYPYPAGKQKFNDAASFARLGKGKSLADWRRANVDTLISKVSATIRSRKPWVRFGISPFGIWRNQSSHPDGSPTNGLQNYDDLYADVLLWAREGWIDYQAPQLYWPLSHDRAPARELADWWNAHACGRHVFIGQDIEKCMDYDELAEKIELSRALPSVAGNCWWYASALTSDYKGVHTALADLNIVPALPPEYPWLAEGVSLPDAPRQLRVADGQLRWRAPQLHETASVGDPVAYVVYRFDSDGDTVDDPSCIQAIVRGADSWDIPEDCPRGTRFTVTALDRVNRESRPAAPVKL